MQSNDFRSYGARILFLRGFRLFAGVPPGRTVLSRTQALLRQTELLRQGEVAIHTLRSSALERKNRDSENHKRVQFGGEPGRQASR